MLFSNTFSNSLKNLAKIIICFSLVYTPFFANASSVGGWTMSNPVAKGASTVYTGIKNITLNGADYVKKGTAIVTPTATGVAKLLARGAAGYALSIAVEQLLGAVDWVLDPANNQIRYKNPDDSSCTVMAECSPLYQYFWKREPFVYTLYASPDPVCQEIASQKNQTVIRIDKTYDTNGVLTSAMCRMRTSTGGTDQWAPTRVKSTVYDPTAEKDDEEKTIPLETVAQQVISNAEAGDTNAQVATTAAAADIVSEAEADQTGVKARPIVQQLEASSTTKPADEAAAEKANEATGEQTKNPDKPDTTDLKLTFPIFCNWAPTVCEAAQTVISFPKTLTNWWETGKEKSESWATSISEAWTSTKEYFKEQPKEQEKTEVEIEDIPKPTQGVTVSIGDNTCPSMPVNIHTPFNTIQSDLSPVYLCQIATGMKAFFIALGFFTASLIVGRRN